MSEGARLLIFTILAGFIIVDVVIEIVRILVRKKNKDYNERKTRH